MKPARRRTRTAREAASSTVAIKEGVRGGVSLLDEKDRTRRQSEETERDNVRTGDRLDEVLNELTKGQFKGRIDRRTFRYEVPGVSRIQDTTFDREYIGMKLLVDYFSLASLNSTMRDEVHRDIEFKEKFATERGYKYLPIIENQFEITKLQRLLARK